MLRMFSTFLVFVFLAIPALGQDSYNDGISDRSTSEKVELFRSTSTTDSYTEELEVQDSKEFRKAVINALSIQGFRTYYETPFASFMRESIHTRSGYLQLYNEAVVWDRGDKIRIHIWKRLSNKRFGNYYVWKMSDSDIREFRHELNSYFTSN